MNTNRFTVQKESYCPRITRLRRAMARQARIDAKEIPEPKSPKPFACLVCFVGRLRTLQALAWNRHHPESFRGHSFIRDYPV
jgi:hypothetical protein